MKNSIKTNSYMRILDRDSDSGLDRVTLLLTADEAHELKNALHTILDADVKEQRHAHVCSENYQREITVALYGDGYTRYLDDRSKRLIEEP